MAMTIDRVSEGLRNNADDLDRMDMLPVLASHLRNAANAIDAHLTQPAQTVDVGAIREVIADMDCDMDMPITADAWRDKLTRALAGEKAEGWTIDKSNADRWLITYTPPTDGEE